MFDFSSFTMPNNKTLVEGGSAIAAIILSVMSIKQVKKYGVLRGDTSSVVAQILLGKVGDVQGISKQIGPNVFLLHKMPWGQSSHNVNILSGFDTAKYDYAITAVNGVMRDKMVKEKNDTGDQTAAVTGGGSEDDKIVDVVFKAIENDAKKNLKSCKLTQEFQIDPANSTSIVSVKVKTATYGFKAPNDAYKHVAGLDENLKLDDKAIKACIKSHINTQRENLPFATTTNGVEAVLEVDPTATSGLQWPFQLDGAIAFDPADTSVKMKAISFNKAYTDDQLVTPVGGRSNVALDKPNLYYLNDITSTLNEQANITNLTDIKNATSYDDLFSKLVNQNYMNYGTEAFESSEKLIVSVDAVIAHPHVQQTDDAFKRLITALNTSLQVIQTKIRVIAPANPTLPTLGEIDAVQSAIQGLQSSVPDEMKEAVDTATEAIQKAHSHINNSAEATTSTQKQKVLEAFGITFPLKIEIDAPNNTIKIPTTPPTPSGGKANLESAIKRAVDAKNMTSVEAKILRTLSKNLFTNTDGKSDQSKKTRSEHALELNVEYLLYKHIKEDGLSAINKHFNYGDGFSEPLKELFTEASKQAKTGNANNMFVIKEDSKSAPAIAYIKTGEPNAEKSTADSTKNGKIPFTFHKKDALSWKGSSLEKLRPNYIQVRDETMKPVTIDLAEKKMANQAFFLIIKTPKAGGEETTIRSETWCCNNQVLWALNKLTIPGMDPIYSEGKKEEEKKSE